MKKINKVILSLLLTIPFISIVNAATIKINDGSAEANTNGNILKIEISGDELKDYNGVSFGLSIPNEISVDRVNINQDAVKGYSYDTESGIYSIDNRGKTLTSSVIATIEYSTTENFNKNVNISLNNVSLYKLGIISGDNSTEEDIDYKKTSINKSDIKAESGTIKYIAPKSKDAYLTDLYVGEKGKYELSPEFDKDTFEYTVIVPDTINRVSINATAVSGATRTGTGSKLLETGENGPYEIVVTAEDGETTNTYKLNIIRGEESEPSAYLKKLTINNIGAKLSPEFDKLNNKYTVKLTKNISKLDIKYEKEDSKATVEIEGNENLQDGENKITITVKASDESDTQIYELVVNKEKEESKEKIVVKEEKQEEEKKNNIWLIVAIVSVIIFIVGSVAFILFRKKKKSKNKKVLEANVVAKPEAQEISEDELGKTTRYEANAFVQKETEEELEKTKEFNFEDFK